MGCCEGQNVRQRVRRVGEGRGVGVDGRGFREDWQKVWVLFEVWESLKSCKGGNDVGRLYCRQVFFGGWRDGWKYIMEIGDK